MERVAQISRFITDLRKINSETFYYLDFYTWSPDGHYLALWLMSEEKKTTTKTVVVLDTETGELTDFVYSSRWQNLWFLYAYLVA